MRGSNGRKIVIGSYKLIFGKEIECKNYYEKNHYGQHGERQRSDRKENGGKEEEQWK